MRTKNQISQIIRALVLLVMLFASVLLHAQKNEIDWRTLNADDIFQQARAKAFNQQREEAREMLQFILRNNPDYFDVRILYARTLSWDNRFTEAREELQLVLSKSPKNEDAFMALTDVEIWSSNFQTALNICNQALNLFPVNNDLLLKKAFSLNKLARDEEALVILNDLLAINPGNNEAAALRKAIQSDKLKFTGGVNYGIDWFSRYFDPAQNLSLQLSRTAHWGSALARLNYSRRFNQSGIQPEVEVYPRIYNGVYAYLNYGYSNSNLYPQHRSGAELFFRVPKSLEFSGGLRNLYFNTDNIRTILTTSASWYFKSNLITLRSYIMPEKEIGTSYSLALTFRKYFKDNNTYVSLNAGAGYSPDERRIQNSSGLSDDQLFKLKTQRLGIVFQKSLINNWIIGGNLEIINQELIFDLDQYVLITSTGLMIRKQF
ncbi:YaiO family outer membrane beta-barrel protein [Chryseotalea sanaruensis]|nr:YaiO family outer membrane beta-barrel protein [Chryseotalea sanaruensis]